MTRRLLSDSATGYSPVKDRGQRSAARYAARPLWLALGIAIGLLIGALSAKAHFQPGTKHNRVHAINVAFCHTLRPCQLGNEALTVARCESGPNLWPWARNGIYWGMFQVSDHWRATVPGWAWNPWAEARHAARVQRLVGWGHWECAT